MAKLISFITVALLTITSAYAAPENKGNRPDFSKLCQGKAPNTKVSANNNGQSMTGTCQLGFKPDNPESLDRGAHRDSNVQNACKSKSKGAKVNVKLNAKNIAGTCDVMFRPEMARK